MISSPQVDWESSLPDGTPYLLGKRDGATIIMRAHDYLIRNYSLIDRNEEAIQLLLRHYIQTWLI